MIAIKFQMLKPVDPQKLFIFVVLQPIRLLGGFMVLHVRPFWPLLAHSNAGLLLLTAPPGYCPVGCCRHVDYFPAIDMFDKAKGCTIPFYTCVQEFDPFHFLG